MSEFSSTGRFLKLDLTAPHHLKVLKLSRKLGISRHEALGITVDLWVWLLNNGHALGELTGMDAGDVAVILGIDPRIDPDVLVAGMLEVGLLDVHGDGTLSVHGWADEGRTGAFYSKQVWRGRHSHHSEPVDGCPYCDSTLPVENVSARKAPARKASAIRHQPDQDQDQDLDQEENQDQERLNQPERLGSVSSSKMKSEDAPLPRTSTEIAKTHPRLWEEALVIAEDNGHEGDIGYAVGVARKLYDQGAPEREMLKRFALKQEQYDREEAGRGPVV